MHVAPWSRIHLPMQDMQEPWVPSLGHADQLEKETATYSKIPALEIPWAEEPGRLIRVHAVTKSQTAEQLRTDILYIYEWYYSKF